MISFGLLFVTILIIIGMLLFYTGLLLDFISPTVLQIQLLGVHLTLFGILIVVAIDGRTGYGFTIGCIGLFTGVLGAFLDPIRTTNTTDKDSDN